MVDGKPCRLRLIKLLIVLDLKIRRDACQHMKSAAQREGSGYPTAERVQRPCWSPDGRKALVAASSRPYGLNSPAVVGEQGGDGARCQPRPHVVGARCQETEHGRRAWLCDTLTISTPARPLPPDSRASLSCRQGRQGWAGSGRLGRPPARRRAKSASQGCATAVGRGALVLAASISRSYLAC